MSSSEQSSSPTEKIKYKSSQKIQKQKRDGIISSVGIKDLSSTSEDDVDIALKSTCVIDINTILKIKVFFHDSTFPYKVDIIDLNAIDKNFYNIIKNDLIKIN